VGPARGVVTLAILAFAVIVSRFGWTLPFVPAAERALYDLRAAWTAPLVAPDKRVVMVVFNDDTLIATRKRSPLDRATLARALRSLDGMGAKGIGIDILVDQEQDEDPQLVEALRAMKTPTFLAYASYDTNANDIGQRQQEFLDEFQKRVATDRTKAASIRLEVDGDNVVRSWPRTIPGLPPLLARALAPRDPAFDGYTGSIRFRQPRFADYGVYDKLPIDIFASGLAIPQLSEQIRGKYVLIGGDIVDYDKFETPLRLATGTTMIGLEVHATILSQLLDRAPFSPIPGWALWSLALGVVVLGALSSLVIGRWWHALPLLALQAVTLAWLPFVLQRQMVDTQDLPVVGSLFAWIIAFVGPRGARRGVRAAQVRARGARQVPAARHRHPDHP
jgi:adenylate cyclase